LSCQLGADGPRQRGRHSYQDDRRQALATAGGDLGQSLPLSPRRFPRLRTSIFAQGRRALLQHALFLGSRLSKHLDVPCFQDGVTAAVHRRNHSFENEFGASHHSPSGTGRLADSHPQKSGYSQGCGGAAIRPPAALGARAWRSWRRWRGCSP
jgi:hypothetical protein